MPFSSEETKILKNTPKVGPKSIQRLEMIGVDSFERLSSLSAEEICFRLSVELSEPRLQKCQLIRAAMQNAIDVSKQASI